MPHKMLLSLENDSKEGKLARNTKLLNYVFLPPHAKIWEESITNCLSNPQTVKSLERLIKTS